MPARASIFWPIPLGRLLARLALPFKLIVLVLFLATLYAGLFGSQDPYRNLAPTLVWIIGWVGLAYVSALIGDVWAVINPWRTLFDAADRLYRQGTGRRFSLNWPYPPALGAWPAVVLLLAFSWTELVYPNPAVPLHIAGFALAYSVLTWSGMLLFGRDAWLRHGEVFSVVFGTFARLAPTEVVVSDPASGRGAKWTLRPYAAGLVSEAASPSMAAFVLLLLSTVLYDGLLGTPEWMAFERALTAPFAGTGERGALAVRTVCLVAFWLLFLGTYRAVSALMSRATGGIRSPQEIARSFAFTLIPIAIGYPRRSLLPVPAGAGPVHRAADLRSVRLWLEPVRHCRLSAGYRDRRRALRLVLGRRRGSARPHRGGLSGACSRDAGLRRARRCCARKCRSPPSWWSTPS